MSRDVRVLYEMSAAQFGVNGALLAASTDSNPIPINGANRVRFAIDYDDNTDGAQIITANIQYRELSQALGGTLGNWQAYPTQVDLPGVIQIDEGILTWTTPAVDGGISFSIPVSGHQMRLSAITGSVGTLAAVSIAVVVEYV